MQQTAASIMPLSGDKILTNLKNNDGKKNPSLFHVDLVWRKKVNRFMSNDWYQLFMTAMLMISLFMSDSWILGNASNNEDDALYAVLLAVFIIFMIETIVMSICMDGYFLGFNFWLDLIGNVSMIIDIGWISDSFLPSQTMTSQGYLFRVTREAKLAARYGRLLRLLRLLRFVKTLPCYQTFVGGSEMDKKEPTLTAIKKVSQELSDTVAIRTSMLILILVVILPFLAYHPIEESPSSWLTNLKIVAKNETIVPYDLQNLARKCYNFYLPKDTNVVSLYVESPYLSDPLDETYPTRSPLRIGNIITFQSSYYVSNSVLVASRNMNAMHYVTTAAETGRDTLYGYVEFQVALKLDYTVPNQMNAMFHIFTLILILIILLVFTSYFNTSVHALVVTPLEKMMITLRNSALMMISTLEKFQSTTKGETNDDDKTIGCSNKLKDKDQLEEGEDSGSEEEKDEEVESAMLEKMIEKLARIMTHVLPTNHVVKEDANIDSATAKWLNQSYQDAGTASTKSPVKLKRRNSLQSLASLRELDQEDTVEDEINLNLPSDDRSPLAIIALPSMVAPATKDALTTWDFDVLPYSQEELHHIVCHLFSNSLPLLKAFRVSQNMFHAFLTAIAARYINHNTYHNYHHAVDVCFTTYRLLTLPGLTYIFTPLEVFALLIAALAHDVGHIGMNNLFLVKTKHTLALQHNDRSPLENMHCVVLYELVSSSDKTAERNVFHALDEKQWRDVRRLILATILGTDMTHHFDQISKTQLFFEMHGQDTKAFCLGQKEEMSCLQDEKNRTFVLELLLHCADISNPYKPFKICQQWASLVAEEFCRQGDKEKELGVEISPMCDRNTMNLYNMQMGFIEFVVSPLILALVNVFPPLYEIAENMLNNFTSWGELKKLDIISETSVVVSPTAEAEECQKLEDRMNKFQEKLRVIATYKELPFLCRKSSFTSIGSSK